ncbi:MAG: hypothetical protein IPH62_07100 [Ignavibacteriae bacterium]|nr:hypothetical protein [Ignavibacteriota bacterium]
MKIYFNTINNTKKKEIDEIFKPCQCDIKFLSYEIYELLSENLEKVIENKALQAYKEAKVPIVVEHGALEIEYLNKFPGALSKPMWDLLDEKICTLIPKDASRKAFACSAVAYCDGKQIYKFIERTEGEISSQKLGNGGFQWDPIFIPNGQNKTYAEMTQTDKLQYSQAKKAYDQLKKHLHL